jgi:hypothetical protein
MNASWKNRLPLALVIALVGIALVASTQSRAARAEREDSSSTSGPRYSVVMTEGHNLLVTDNNTNKIYFYTIDKDKPIGSPLVLRAHVDLNQVGKDEVHITPHNLENFKPEGKK